MSSDILKISLFRHFCVEKPSTKAPSARLARAADTHDPQQKAP